MRAAVAAAKHRKPPVAVSVPCAKRRKPAANAPPPSSSLGPLSCAREFHIDPLEAVAVAEAVSPQVFGVSPRSPESRRTSVSSAKCPGSPGILLSDTFNATLLVQAMLDKPPLSPCRGQGTPVGAHEQLAGSTSGAAYLDEMLDAASDVRRESFCSDFPDGDFVLHTPKPAVASATVLDELLLPPAIAEATPTAATPADGEPSRSASECGPVAEPADASPPALPALRQRASAAAMHLPRMLSAEAIKLVVHGALREKQRIDDIALHVSAAAAAEARRRHKSAVQASAAAEVEASAECAERSDRKGALERLTRPTRCFLAHVKTSKSH